MENEEIKNNKAADNQKDVSDSRSVADEARNGLFNEAMKEMGMPDGKANSEKQIPGSKDRSVTEENATGNRDRSVNEEKAPGNTDRNPNEEKSSNLDSKNKVDPASMKDGPSKLDEMAKNKFDPSVMKDTGSKLDEMAKNKFDPSVLKDTGTKLDEMVKNPIDPSVLKDTGTKLDEMVKNPIDPSVLKDPGDQKIDPNDIKNPADKLDVNDLKGLESNKNIGELLKELSTRNHEYMKPFGKGGDGDHILPTGDRIERSNGQETLTTPNGDTVTVNPDGTFRTTGDVRKINENKDGTHTITYGDGSKVTIGRNGVEKVERGNDRVRFHDLSRNNIKAVGMIKQLNPPLQAR